MMLPPIYVFGCDRRPSLAVQTLSKQCVPHTLHVGEDYYPPPNTAWHRNYAHPLRRKLTAHYRVFRGHRDMAARFLRERPDAPAALMLEDDAVPNHPDWLKIVHAAVDYLCSRPLHLLGLHGRQVPMRNYTVSGEVAGRKILRLKTMPLSPPGPGGHHHIYGFSMAYLITRTAAKEFVAGPEWSGIPIDMWLPDNFGSELLTPTIFEHDRSQGSLVDESENSPPH